MIIIASVAGLVTISVGGAGLVRWIFRKGQESGKQQAAHAAEQLAQTEAKRQEQARMKALEAEVAQIKDEAQVRVKVLEGLVDQLRAELDSIRAQQAKALRY